MNNQISKVTDEMGELVKDVGKSAVREIKDMGKIAKSQITGQQISQDDKAQSEPKPVDPINDKKKKTDPITGKPIPTKQQLSDLKQQTAQLQMSKLRKVREELDKQRLKVSQESPLQQTDQVGPEIKKDEKKVDDSVAKTLKGSKSTGEFKGLIGG